MSEEEKKAIELLKKLQKKTPYIIWGDGTPYNKNNQIQTILNLIDKLQKEINFYKNEELGYIAGYEDGKRHKQTAVMIKKENAQQELFEKEIEELKEKNAQLTNYLNDSYYVSADKIKEKIKKAKEIKWHTPKLVIEYFEDLLEEN